MYKKLYPLKFKPTLVGRVWGGDALVTGYHKELPEDLKDSPEAVTHIGESWEITAMDEERDSVVAEGFLADNTLTDLLETYMGDLVGDKIFDRWNLQFPLLVKYLDVNDYLSVQVHPDDETALERFDSLGKDEMWYIMDAKPEAKMYLGFKRDTDASEFYLKCKDGSVTELLNEIHPKKGDCYMIKAGTVHACGGGVVIAEIQEPSDITFRLYDWGREFNPSTARQMHLEEAIDCIDYKAFDAGSRYVPSSEGITKVAECDNFIAYTLRLDSPRKVSMDDDAAFLVYMCVEGEASLQIPEGKSTATYTLVKGESLLVPSSSPDFILVPSAKDTILLEVHTGNISEEIDSYINPGTEPLLPEDKQL